MSIEATNIERNKMARELRSIKELHGDLEDQAIHHSDDADMPGGFAMVMLGPSANMEAYNYRVLSVIMGRIDGNDGEDDFDSDPAPPLLVVAGWEDLVRDALDRPTDLKATVERSCDFLGKQLDWLWGVDEDGDPNYEPVEELAIDLRKLRVRMEDVLLAGERYEFTETPCDQDDCGGVYLVKLYGTTVSLDRYGCVNCKAQHDLDGYVQIRKMHMYSTRADDAWIDISAAAKSINRSQWTIRCWMKARERDGVAYEEPRVKHRRVGLMNRIEVFWPDVRDQNEATRRRDKLRHAKVG